MSVTLDGDSVGQKFSFIRWWLALA
jgi:hypothetical protein